MLQYSGAGWEAAAASLARRKIKPSIWGKVRTLDIVHAYPVSPFSTNAFLHFLYVKRR